MTPQLTTEAFAALGAPDLVYVRPVKARERRQYNTALAHWGIL